jgi:hypothetical protein
MCNKRNIDKYFVPKWENSIDQMKVNVRRLRRSLFIEQERKFYHDEGE